MTANPVAARNLTVVFTVRTSETTSYLRLAGGLLAGPPHGRRTPVATHWRIENLLAVFSTPPIPARVESILELLIGISVNRTGRAVALQANIQVSGASGARWVRVLQGSIDTIVDLPAAIARQDVFDLECVSVSVRNAGLVSQRHPRPIHRDPPEPLAILVLALVTSAKLKVVRARIQCVPHGLVYRVSGVGT